MKAKFMYEKVYQQLFNKIKNGEYKSGSVIPSERELCQEYDVSLITVRRALKELEELGLIRKFKGKGSVVNENIKSTDTKQLKKTIGILDVPFMTQVASTYPDVPVFLNSHNANQWKETIYFAIQKALIPEYNVFFGTYTKEQIMNQFDTTVFRDIERILITGYYDKEMIELLNAKGKMILLFNNFDDEIRACNVTSDERKMTFEAVNRLIQLGHRKIAAINGDITYSESIERYMGFQMAMVQNQVMLNSHYVKWGNMTAQSGYYLTKELVRQGDIPTAIVCVNDNVAAGVIIALREIGIKCPDEISVVGHDNNELAFAEVFPELTTIDPKYETIGEEIARKLIRNVWVEDTSVIESELIYRGSISRVRDL